MLYIAQKRANNHMDRVMTDILRERLDKLDATALRDALYIEFQVVKGHCKSYEKVPTHTAGIKLDQWRRAYSTLDMVLRTAELDIKLRTAELSQKEKDVITVPDEKLPMFLRHI